MQIDCAWFEIPVSDMKRAMEFYSKIFEIKMESFDAGPLKMAVFPHGNSGGSLVEGPTYVPGESGPVLYLNASPDLEPVLARVENAGGSVLQNKKLISEEHGYMGLFVDSEGNRLALWSKT